jgi:hypothetical protein
VRRKKELLRRVGKVYIPHHETFSNTIQPPHSSTKGWTVYPQTRSTTRTTRSTPSSTPWAGPPGRAIPDCHFSVQLNHFRPGLLSYLVAVFRK